MRKVWARVGISFWVTDEDYAALIDRRRNGDDTLTDEEARRVQLLGKTDGESYIPEIVLDEAVYDTQHNELEAVKIGS